MIKSFADKNTEAVFKRESVRKFRAFEEEAWMKLVYIDSAEELGDLAQTPGNRLEKLKGDRKGQWSLRINKQWRICFTWRKGDAHDVEICDYH